MHCVVNINEEKVLLKQTAPESYHWSYLNRFPVALHSCTEPLQVTSTPAVTVHIPRVAEFEVYGDASIGSQRFKIQTAQIYSILRTSSYQILLQKIPARLKKQRLGSTEPV